MNIILEGGINFYDELNNIDTDDEDKPRIRCRIRYNGVCGSTL